ncbi:hypothetical protein [Nocardia sp. NPDC005998]|uniref:hypothetical protein n=1 Tax=Nocardia sp. NPDC005998 TaxID=3156894 RepID=UPI0033B88D1F
MVSSQHEAMHRLFQHDPGTFARAFRALGLPFPEPLEVLLLSTDLTEPAPVERRADTVLRVSSAQGQFLLLVEAQSKHDPTRPAAWAYYVAFLHAKYVLPIVLLVVCQDRVAASWARGPLPIGMPQWTSLTVHPLVLGPHNVPPVTEVEVAASDIPLATLSAITHAKEECAGAILETLAAALRSTGGTPEHNIFAELTELGLGDSPAADIWRKLMSLDLSFFRSPTSQAMRAEVRANYILRVLDRHGIPVSDEIRTRVLTCTDNAILDQWFDRALTATDAIDLFGNES